MDWDFTAITSTELASGIARALLQGRVSKRIALEKIQITRLLESLARTAFLEYPIHVRHTTNHVPDVQIALAARRVGVELTRIKLQDIEHGRALQERGMRTTLMTSNLLQKSDGPRRKKDIIKEGFGIPAMLFPFSTKQEELIWLSQAKATLEAKTLVVSRKDFDHGVEDWLVIIDPIGATGSEVEVRRNEFSRILTEFWKPGWFSRVFLQDNYFRWQMMFIPHEAIILPLFNAPISN